MEPEVFKAGTRFGAPATNDEIKILVCYILSETGASMSFAQIHEALTENELVNYFELVSAINSLVRTGHLSETETPDSAGFYAITGLGKNTADTINTLLPPSVRERASVAAGRILRRERREREVTVKITEASGGYEVFLALPESGGNLSSFSLFCPTKEEAALVKKNFLNDPVFIYKGVTALLTGNKNVIGEIFKPDESLF